jgi:hypothetical protein
VRAEGVRTVAARGMAGGAGELPHLSVLQPAFGGHDLRGVKAHVGEAPARAAAELGAEAYTVGERIAFRAPPDLHTAAHEAAHVVQQRSGVDLPHGVGRRADRYERHADAVAGAVVEGGPVGPLLAPFGPSPGAAPAAVQAKDAAEEDVDAGVKDVDAIERAGKRANERVAKNDENDAEMMLDGASIFYRLMRTFFPEVLARWNFSGVSFKREYHGVTMQRSGNDVAVTVGPDFVLGTTEHGLAGRIVSLQSALPSLENDKKTWAVVATTASTGGPPTRAEALKEGSNILAAKAGFGVTSGLRTGADEYDGYDARFWSEAGRVITAKVEPWYAMSQLVAHLDDEVPKEGGGMTHWHFDCWEGAQVTRAYADWRTMTREAFNQKNSPLEIGFLSPHTRNYYEKPVFLDQPGDKPYTSSDEPQEVKGHPGTFEYVKTPVGKSMTAVLDEAPVGAWVIWSNRDVKAKIAAFSKRIAAGETLSPEEQDLNDRIQPWENENTLKVGKDQYAAFPFGVVDEKTIVDAMAEIVFSPNPVPADYIEKNIYISSIRIEKPDGRATPLEP